MADKKPAVNTTNPVINDIVSNYSARKKFWKDGEMEECLSDLICSTAWRNEIEAYEYISYVVDLTYSAVRKFPDVKRSFWEPILVSYFNSQLGILKDEDSEGYSNLSNYFPLTPQLKECQDILSKLSTLVIIDKQTRGCNGKEVESMGKDYYDKLSKSFNNIGDPNRYMSYQDVVKVYKTVVMNGLSCMITIENMASSQMLPENMQPIAKTVAAPQPNTSAETQAPNKGNVAASAPAEKSAQAAAPAPASAQAPAQKPEAAPAEPEANPEDKLDMVKVSSLIDGTSFTLEKFIDMFQTIESLYYIAQRHKNEREMTFFASTLGDMFVSFDKQYVIMQKSKPQRGLKPDLQKWDETRSHINKFKEKCLNSSSK